MADYKFCPRCGKPLEKGTREGRERLLCSSPECGYVFWDNPLPVVAALVEYRGKILLARNRAWPEKVFALITGFLEKDESPEEGVLREVREELNLDGTIEGMIGVYGFTQANQLIVAYHVKAEGEITLNEELAEVREVPFDRLKAWPFGTGLAVRDWLAGRKGTC